MESNQTNLNAGDVVNVGVKDQTKPQGKWRFDEPVAAAFEDMLSRSIPQYDVMRKACFDVGNRFVVPNEAIVDLGCSLGTALLPFAEKHGAYNWYVGVEMSEPMRERARENLRSWIDYSQRASVVNIDLRHEYPKARACLTLCVLTLQFIPIEYRLQLLHRAWESTVKGGALILVEKVLGSTAAIDDAMTSIYREHKLANGYSAEDVDRKKLSLEGVLVPVRAEWNEQFLRLAGFSQLDCFWRFMNFAAWVAIKS